MAVFLCATAMFGSLGIFLVGQLQAEIDVETQEGKGRLLAANTAIPCLIASVFFYIAGIFYGQVKREIEMEKEDALTKASHFNFERDDKDSVQSYGAFQFDEHAKSYRFEKGGMGFHYTR